jgi:hypothetical protein
VVAHHQSRQHQARVSGPDGHAADFGDAQRRISDRVARVFNGETPSDLPMKLHTKFEPVIRLKAAKTPGSDVAPSLLALADYSRATAPKRFFGAPDLDKSA